MDNSDWQRYVRQQFQIVEHQLGQVIRHLHNSKVHFTFGVGPVTTKPKTKDKPMLEITITNEQKVNVQLHPVTGGGNPAQLDGTPSWEVVNGNATVEPAEDGLSADLISPEDPGDTQFIVKADADLGGGVQEISDIITLHVNHANASSLGLTASDPVSK